MRSMKVSSLKAEQKKRIHFSVLISSVCLLLSFLIWDHYFDSEVLLDRMLVSKIILITGIFFSISAGLFTHSLESRTERLEREIKDLHGFIPICAHCKKIRNDSGSWEQLELYLQRHSDAKFSHGVCKECAVSHYPQIRHTREPGGQG